MEEYRNGSRYHSWPADTRGSLGAGGGEYQGEVEGLRLAGISDTIVEFDRLSMGGVNLNREFRRRGQQPLFSRHCIKVSSSPFLFFNKSILSSPSHDEVYCAGVWLLSSLDRELQCLVTVFRRFPKKTTGYLLPTDTKASLLLPPINFNHASCLPFPVYSLTLKDSSSPPCHYYLHYHRLLSRQYRANIETIA